MSLAHDRNRQPGGRDGEMVREYEYALDYDDPLIAFLYDRSETYTDDVALIRKLLTGENLVCDPAGVS